MGLYEILRLHYCKHNCKLTGHSGAPFGAGGAVGKVRAVVAVAIVAIVASAVASVAVVAVAAVVAIGAIGAVGAVGAVGAGGAVGVSITVSSSSTFFAALSSSSWSSMAYKSCFSKEKTNLAVALACFLENSQSLLFCQTKPVRRTARENSSRAYFNSTKKE